MYAIVWMPNSLEVKAVKFSNAWRDCMYSSLPYIYSICLQGQHFCFGPVEKNFLKCFKIFQFLLNIIHKQHFLDKSCVKFGKKKKKEKRYFLLPCPLISNLFISLFVCFKFNFRGLLKYQTNLDTHPPGCINLNRTSSQNISLPEYFSEHFHEPFPEEFSKPEEFTQNTFVKICMEEPRFQANFPQVRLILCLISTKFVSIWLINITYKRVFQAIYSCLIGYFRMFQ